MNNLNNTITNKLWEKNMEKLWSQTKKNVYINIIMKIRTKIEFDIRNKTIPFLNFKQFHP